MTAEKDEGTAEKEEAETPEPRDYFADEDWDTESDISKAGESDCSGCQHLDRKTRVCRLRRILIERPFWTTCKNLTPFPGRPRPQFCTSSGPADGPVCSIVCGIWRGIYGFQLLPWFDGNRVDAVLPQEVPADRSRYSSLVVLTDRDGVTHSFNGCFAYIAFWKANTPEERR